MSVPPLRFADTSESVRLGLFERMRDAIASARDARELHQSLVGSMMRFFGVACYVEVSTENLPSAHYRVTRVWREDGSEGVPNCSPWQTEGVPVRSGGVIADVVARSEPSLVPAFSFPPDDAAFAELGQYHSLAACPGALGQRDHWVFILDPCADEYSSATLDYLLLRVMLIGSALKNLQTATELQAAYRKLTVATEFIQSEVDRIAAIQKALLPPPRPVVPGLDVAAWSETYDRAGGDLYDYTALSSGHWSFLIADASGHGPSAAVPAAILSTMLHTMLQRPGSPLVPPAGLLAFANDQLVDRQIEHSFVTAFIAHWNPLARTLTYSRAGHNPPLFLRSRDLTIHELSEAGGLPLGIFAHAGYDQEELGLCPGDVLIMFSDGIVEAEDANGEQFGLEGLRKILASTPRRSAQDLLIATRSAVQTHQKNVRPLDDQTLMILRAI
jgi:phosphoserine phosphatase RsbU/P